MLWSMISSLLSILYTVRTARNPQSLLTVLFMETQLMPIQRADVATAPLAQICSMFTSELPSFLSLSPPFISVCFPCFHQFSVRGAVSGCRLFRAIVLSKCDFWDMKKPDISWSLIPVLSLHWSSALLRDLRALDTDRLASLLERDPFSWCVLLGKKSFVFT